MTRRTHQIVLPADVYDTLELSALAYGGVGGGWHFDSREQPPTPLCAYGHAAFADALPRNDVTRALGDAGIGPFGNDDAVARINERRGKFCYARVSFEEWCQALNVVRGEQP